MRLIDADKLYKHLIDWAFAEAPTDLDVGEVKAMREVIYKTIKDCMRAVDEQPTAYDVGKVVEELDAKRYGEPCEDNYEAGYDQAIYEAIDTAKRGGLDE